MMVVGGTVAGTLIGQEARYVLLALKGVLQTYKSADGGRDVLLSEVGKIIDWSYGVQKNGVLALEKEVETVKDDALMRASSLTVSTSFSKAKTPFFCTP